MVVEENTGNRERTNVKWTHEKAMAKPLLDSNSCLENPLLDLQENEQARRTTTNSIDTLLWSVIKYETPFVFRLFRRLRRIAKSEYELRHVCLSVRTQQIGYHWMDFHEISYTGCPRRNEQNFESLFLMLNYTDITQNTYIQSWTFTEIMAIEKCGLLWCPRTVRRPWRHTSPLRMPGNKKPLANVAMQWPWRD